MFDKFKHLSRILGFIFIFNLLIFNFGIEPKKASASVLDISATRIINYDLRYDGQYLVFDFSRYLNGNEKIESFVLKRNNNTIKTEHVNNEKKAWKSKIILLDGDECTINAVASIGNQQRKLVYNATYIDREVKYRPEFSFKNDDLEIIFNQDWLNLLDDEDLININLEGIVSENSVKVKDIKNNQNTKVFKDKKNNFGGNSGFDLYVAARGKTYKWKVYTYDKDSKRHFGLMGLEIKSAKFKNNSNTVEMDLVIKDKIKLENNDVFRPIRNGKVTNFDINKKTAKFEVEDRLGDDITMRLDQKNGKKFEGFARLGVLRNFDKLDIKLTTTDIDAKELKIDLLHMEWFLSKTDSKNKLNIYELNDNFAKGSIFLEKVGVTKGVNTLNIGNKKLNKNKTYLVELNNGTGTLTTTFVYTPMDISVTDIGQTEANVKWVYPVGYTPVQGDEVSIYLKERSEGTYSSIPKVNLVHNSKIQANTADFTKVSSAKLTAISPGKNYDIKVVLKNQRGSLVSEGEFSTKTFLLTKPIEIKDAVYDNSDFKNAQTRSKNMTVQWDIDTSKINFAPEDRVEIWVKNIGSAEFSGYPQNEKFNNPVFTANNNLKNLKSADIKIPTWFERFHVDLIYTIGGKRVLNPKDNSYGEASFNRRVVTAKVNQIGLNVTDKTETSAKVTWTYDPNFTGIKKYEPENGHMVEVHVKKIASMNDYTNSGFDDNNRKLHVKHGENNQNLLEHKELALTGLDVGQSYRVRVRHTLEEGKFVENFYNFETVDFSIDNLKADQQQRSPKIELKWGTSSEPKFGEGETEKDNIKIYLKESTTSEYPETPLEGVNVEDIKNEEQKTRDGDSTDGTTKPEPKRTKKCTIELPKYNTLYNVKVEYTLQGKKISNYVLVEAKGDLTLDVTDIKQNTSGSRDANNEWTAKVKWSYPNGYTKRDNDKIRLTVKKKASTPSTREENSLPTDEEISVDKNDNGEKDLKDLEANQDYDVILKFMNGDAEVYKTETSFKATNDLQIVGLKASDVKAKTATISWNYTPDSKNFKDGTSKVEIYIKENKKEEKEKKDSQEGQKNNDDLSDYKKIYTAKHKNGGTEKSSEIVTLEEADQNQHSKHEEKEQDLKKFKSLNLKDLVVNKDYSIKVKYVGVDDATAQANEVTVASGGSGKDAEAEVRFKTLAEKFNATVFVSNQTSATYGWDYPVGYTVQNGDKIKIFVKEVNETSGGSKRDNDNGIGTDYGSNPLLELEHGSGDGKYDLNEVTRVDISGLTPEKKYKSRIDFTMGTGDSAHTISTEVDISTKSFEIKSFTLDSYQEYDILVQWEIEPQNMIFNPADTLEIFVKLADATNYPNEPAYKLTTDSNSDDKNISNTFSDYVLAETIGKEQKMKLVYTVGGKKYEKELTFTNSIDPIKAEVSKVDETRALIEFTPPSNYEFVDGDRLLIYAKDEFSDGDVYNEDFLVFEGVQSETLSIADGMRFIELSYLLPEAKYDVMVALDLEDGTVNPVKLEFTTKPLPLSDIKLESINYNGGTISWNYGENAIDFFEGEDTNDTDMLLVGLKESDGTPIEDSFDAIKQIAIQEHSGSNIINVKDSKIEVEDRSKDYDVAICCDIGGLSYIKKSKLSFLYSSVNEETIDSKLAVINWKYPSNITFGENDKTDIFIKNQQDVSYPESPLVSFNGSGTTSYNLEGLNESTEYVAKIQIVKEGLKIDPVEVTFTTKANVPSDVVVEDLEYEVTGTSAEFLIPNIETVDIETDGVINLRMGDEVFSGFTARFNDDGTGFIIEPTIPKKKYENIEIELPLKNGETFRMVIKEFVTQPSDIAQEWLSNAYWFAFERFPDEEGYGYWYGRMKDKKLNGEYFLKNLMFAEDEFTNRNLSDRDLIAALYQIVVNREYDEEGLNFWIGIYNENLQNAQGNKKLAQEVLVDRMVHEPEFGKLCDKVGIFWRQTDQDAAGVVS